MPISTERDLTAVMFARYRPRPGRVALPDVCCDLVWSRERLWLSGPMRRAQPTSRAGEEVQLLNLDPLAARAWAGVPLEELVDRSIPLDDIDAGAAGRLSAQFFEGRAGDMVRPLQRPPDTYARAAAAAAVLRRGRPVDHAAAAAELSRRQLERLFADQFGLSPWEYALILRFRRAVGSVRAGRTLAEAAAIAGYADQSHFTRATRALTGHSPSALLAHVANVQDAVALTRDY